MKNKFTTGFIKTLWILRDYLNEIVVGGGWAPILYSRYLLQDKQHELVHTRDIDFMVKEKVPIVGSKTVDQLLAEANFEAVFKSRDNPPLIHYEGIIENEEVEVEFLTDQVGSNPEIVLKVQEGLHAEALRFISIIVDNVIEVQIDEPLVIQNPSCLKVKVPTPAAYIFNKGLIFVRRKDGVKKAKDLYYIFDILANLPDLRSDIVNEFRGLAERYTPWFNTLLNNLSPFFKEPESEGVLLVLEQKPTTAFIELDDDQLKHYIYGIFKNFLKELINFKLV